MSGIAVQNISDCLQTAADLFDWTTKRKTYKKSLYGIQKEFRTNVR